MDINVVLEGTEEFAKLDPHMQLITMLTFIHIAQRGISNQQDIELLLGTNSASASRNVAYWTDVKHGGDAGFNFIQREEDPRDRRSKLLRLTKEGKAFYNKLQSKKGSASNG